MFGWFKKRNKAATPEPQSSSQSEPVSQKIPEELSSLCDTLARQAVRMNLSKPYPPKSPFASWSGKVFVAAPGETWPMSKSGSPMYPICQLNLTELPYKPDVVSGLAFITVFIAPEEFYDGTGMPNGSCWAVRSYASLDNLQPVEEPMSFEDWKSGPLIPEVVDQDYPDAEHLLDGVYEMFEEKGVDYCDACETASGLKIGGWPCVVQSELFWDFQELPGKPVFAFQIDSDDTSPMMWGDTGVVYFARGKTPEGEDIWEFDWQCC